jgi:hypothetical protein
VAFYQLLTSELIAKVSDTISVRIKEGGQGRGTVSCPNACLLPLLAAVNFRLKAEILKALPKLNAEERREIRAKMNELDSETWFDNGEEEKAIIEARLDEYDRNPEVGSSWEETKARILAGLHTE